MSQAEIHARHGERGQPVEPIEAAAPPARRQAVVLRWAIAAGAVLVLAWLVFPFVVPRRGGASGTAPGNGPGSAAPVRAPAAAACDPKAAPAKLDFVLKDMRGERVALSAFKGKALVINFWATWCPPCKGEIPALVELQKKYADQGLVVLGVSTDDPPDALRQFAEAYQINYPVLLGTEEFMDAYGPIWAIPVSVFVTREATICRTHMGPATLGEFERQIKALL